MVKFKDKFKKIEQMVEAEKMQPGFDNVMGLNYLDSMVDVYLGEELGEHVHKYLRAIIEEAMEFNYQEEKEEFMVSYG